MPKFYFQLNPYNIRYASRIGAFVIAGAILFSCESSSQTSFESEYEEYTVEEVSVVKEPESIYRGNQLENGSSPFNDCFGSGKYAGQAWIEFKNDYDSDAVVCLVNVHTDKVVRNEYIKADNNFKMTKIPAGTYYLKIYQGNDWNPTLQNFCGTNGGFETNEDFSISDNPSDHIQVENSEYGYSSGSITLYQVSNGNMTIASITAEDFFRN